LAPVLAVVAEGTGLDIAEAGVGAAAVTAGKSPLTSRDGSFATGFTGGESAGAALFGFPALGLGGRGLGRYFVLSPQPIATSSNANVARIAHLGWLLSTEAPYSRIVIGCFEPMPSSS
jgi:hypothetical protein